MLELIKQNIRGFILSLIFTAIWSMSILLTTVTLNYVPKYTLLATIFIPAAIMAILFFLFDKKKIPKVNKSDWIKIVLAALVGVTLAQYFIVARRFTDAPPGTDVIFILNLSPLFMLFLAGMFYFEELNFPKVIGMITSTLGMVVILANWELPSTFSPFVRYFQEEKFLLAAAFCWAVFSILIKDLVKRVDTSFLAACLLTIGSIPLAILALSIDGIGSFSAISVSSFNIIATLSLVGSLIGYLVWIDTLKATAISKAGVTMTTSPLLITLLIAVERRITPMGISPLQTFPISFGFLLIILGLLVVWKEKDNLEVKNNNKI